MPFIFAGFIGLFLLAAVVWLAFFLRTKRQEDTRIASEERAATRERLLLTPGETLYCAACQKTFDGPLPDEGCPYCHCAAFVVPDRLRAQIGGERSAADAVRVRTQGQGE